MARGARDTGVQLLSYLFVLAAVVAQPTITELKLRAAVHSDETPGVNTYDALQNGANYTKDAEADRVTDLPGWGKTQFGLFGGYVTVDEDAGRALYYVLAESARDPGNDPLVLWLNGGPGCSSLAGGFMSELGPFYPTPSGDKLVANKYAWHQNASLLFLESPAFVGWSYSNTSADTVVGDRRTARDARVFLERWLQRFPQYAGRPFWIAGESYGGHYVPNLADEILDSRQARLAREGRVRHVIGTADDDPINLQGFLVGNPWTDADADNEGAVDFWWAHALISDETARGIKRTCNFSRIGPLATSPDADNGAACDQFVMRAGDEMGPINIYEVYADVCLPSRATQEARQLAALTAGQPGGLAASPALRDGQYDPCVDNEVERYFNRPDVQRALHANTTNLPYPWTGCSRMIRYSMEDLFSSMLPVYRRLLKDGLRMLVYSGDVDGIVPVVGTRRWTAGLDLPEREPWRPYMPPDGQVGGYTVAYRGLTFATVRNAGHMVPYTQAARAYYLFTQWIADKPL